MTWQTLAPSLLTRLIGLLSVKLRKVVHKVEGLVQPLTLRLWPALQEGPVAWTPSVLCRFLTANLTLMQHPSLTIAESTLDCLVRLLHEEDCRQVRRALTCACACPCVRVRCLCCVESVAVTGHARAPFACTVVVRDPVGGASCVVVRALPRRREALCDWDDHVNAFPLHPEVLRGALRCTLGRF